VVFVRIEIDRVEQPRALGDVLRIPSKLDRPRPDSVVGLRDFPAVAAERVHGCHIDHFEGSLHWKSARPLLKCFHEINSHSRLRTRGAGSRPRFSQLANGCQDRVERRMSAQSPIPRVRSRAGEEPNELYPETVEYGLPSERALKPHLAAPGRPHAEGTVCRPVCAASPILRCSARKRRAMGDGDPGAPGRPARPAGQQGLGPRGGARSRAPRRQRSGPEAGRVRRMREAGIGSPPTMRSPPTVAETEIDSQIWERPFHRRCPDCPQVGDSAGALRRARELQSLPTGRGCPCVLLRRRSAS